MRRRWVYGLVLLWHMEILSNVTAIHENMPQFDSLSAGVL